MRIDGRHAFLQAYVQKVGSRGEPGATNASVTSLQEDEVSLSGLAKDVQMATEHMASLPDVREERVAEVRARIERGEYYVSAEELADRILQSGALDAPEGLLI